MKENFEQVFLGPKLGYNSYEDHQQTHCGGEVDRTDHSGVRTTEELPFILQEDNPEVLAILVATHARESGVNTEAVAAAPDVTKGKRVRTQAESDASDVNPKKKKKVAAAPIPKKKRVKAEHIITKEQLDEAFEAIDKEEHEPKKKKAPLQIMSSMVTTTKFGKYSAS